MLAGSTARTEWTAAPMRDVGDSSELRADARAAHDNVAIAEAALGLVGLDADATT